MLSNDILYMLIQNSEILLSFDIVYKELINYDIVYKHVASKILIACTKSMQLLLLEFNYSKKNLCYFSEIYLF